MNAVSESEKQGKKTRTKRKGVICKESDNEFSKRAHHQFHF